MGATTGQYRQPIFEYRNTAIGNGAVHVGIGEPLVGGLRPPCPFDSWCPDEPEPEETLCPPPAESLVGHRLVPGREGDAPWIRGFLDRVLALSEGRDIFLALRTRDEDGVTPLRNSLESAGARPRATDQA